MSHPERNKRLIQDREAGAAYRQLSAKYGITVERCRQIVAAGDDRARPLQGEPPDADAVYADECPIEDIPLGSRAFNALKRAHYRTARSIRRATDKELRRHEGIGEGILDEIRELLPYRDPDGPMAQIRRDPALRAAEGVTNEVLRERYRQMRAEGWTAGHDDGHTDRSLAKAASCYAWHASLPDDDRELSSGFAPRGWPGTWDAGYWKPKDRRRDLVRAAALVVAEIERLDREEDGVARSSADVRRPDRRE